MAGIRISGTELASELLRVLKRSLSLCGLTPTMTVILIGDNPASLSYIRQKQKTATEIGAKLHLVRFPASVTEIQLSETIDRLNHDARCHGIIIQRPIPKESRIPRSVICAIDPQKDIDGFVPGSHHTVPVANAVLLILRRVCTFNTENDDHQFFLTWLKKKRISVIGRGETAGAPIAGMLKKLHCTTSILHTETPDPSAVTRMSDIIVSCVGKPKTVTRDMISNRPILVSVGLAKDESGRLVGDYDEQEIRDQCSYYTPTPGGVGPVNVACLMNNLVSAASII